MNKGSKRFRDLLAKVVSRRRNVVEDRDLTPAAVLVPVVFRGDEPHLIVTKRTMEVAVHKGQISFPGGVSEPEDDGPTATALREANEEIGLDPKKVEVVGLLDDLATTTGFAVTPVVGFVASEVAFSPEPVEVAEVIEVPVSALFDRSNYRQKRDESDAARRNYHSYEVNGVVIWGATAAIINRLIAAFEDEERMGAGGTILTLAKGDITRHEADAIVNAANSSLLGGGGVDGAIHRAGGPEILDECKAIRARQGGCQPGEAVITTAGRLPARRVIHTVGPIWRGGDKNEAQVLARCYKNSLTLAVENGLRTIAFPSISTGAYGYPAAEAAKTAVEAVREFVRDNPKNLDRITWVLFDDETFEAYRSALQA